MMNAHTRTHRTIWSIQLWDEMFNMRNSYFYYDIYVWGGGGRGKRNLECLVDYLV